MGNNYYPCFYKMMAFVCIQIIVIIFFVDITMTTHTYYNYEDEDCVFCIEHVESVTLQHYKNISVTK